MSAIQTDHNIDTNTFYFKQNIAVSSYLFAIGVGYLVSYDLRGGTGRAKCSFNGLIK